MNNGGFAILRLACTFLLLSISASTITPGEAANKFPTSFSHSNISSTPYPPPPKDTSHSETTDGNEVNRVLDLSHDSTTSTVHVRDEYYAPYAGLQRFSIPSMSDHIFVTVDDVPVSHQIVDSYDTNERFVDVEVPHGAESIMLRYDQLDGTIAFENHWYIAFSWVWGPMTIYIHLPDTANIIRYSDIQLATIINSQTMRYDVPQYTPVAITVIYQTSHVPNQYYSAITPHFTMHLPDVYRGYEDDLGTALEALYDRYGLYLGYDVNQQYQKSTFDYYFPPGGWNWWNTEITLTGGLCIVGGGPCAVNRFFIPSILLRPDANDGGIKGYLAHELGHGWQGIIGSANLPWWIHDGEGFPSFLNHLAWSDLGLCPFNSDGYLRMFEYYQEYLVDQSVRRDYASIVISSGLQKIFGWEWMRQMHQDIVAGFLDLTDLSEQQKTDEMIRYLSNVVGENLVGYFDQSLIFASQSVRDSLAHLPESSATPPEEWPCPSGKLKAEISKLNLQLDNSVPRSIVALKFTTDIGQQIWTVQSNAKWIKVQSSTGISTPIYSDKCLIDIDLTGYSDGWYSTELHVLSNGPGGEEILLPVNVLVEDMVSLFVPIILP